ncbi:hypothetical protein C8F04DRAFT_1251534 [Mycena alexandri]|uniref:Uncharacterized protein n=1 Tax=Mycena alexandri TaxID=1745969 RepID=A0AAD6TBN4_9AGAR|nr:hypothetical protein C8F04DRAFT_1281204 [Mycena alexandri]KAJ7039680.1 hypothetical protein C8F04DRAFT_1254952 [Mycena alexandri]KAJ7042722.1 hypothetical protein C8F04DRAFT_1251534 [Mycena alexandri]
MAGPQQDGPKVYLPANLSTKAIGENENLKDLLIQRSLRIPTHLSTVSMLGTHEAFAFKLDMASELLTSLEAESHLIHIMLAEAKAEARLAACRETEARRRVQYFSRLCEMVSQNMDAAKLQYTVLKAERPVEEDDASNIEDNKLINVTLD